ncbi:hypothetical protein C1Y40_05353 [Mycobacterium talmoniae]|uniref:Uncharacterized protein n=1 Tax=Mycobacterium talmoniae TaxID=1858794 RepID=A0A2S8BCW5_9MYCO|nr:hypothetical protein C1Y40_05353 [Mycobacterium talmoniae]
MTGTPNCCESLLAMPGIFAPPPTAATATDRRHPVAVQGASHRGEDMSRGWRIASSRVARVSGISPRNPDSSTPSPLVVCTESCSLAWRHRARNRASDPIDEVAETPNEPLAFSSASTWVSNAWSICSPEKSVWRTVTPIGR